MDNSFRRYQNLLTTYIDSRALPVLYNNWTSFRRHYHTLNHLDDVIKYIEKFHDRVNQEKFEQVILAGVGRQTIARALPASEDLLLATALLPSARWLNPIRN